MAWEISSTCPSPRPTPSEVKTSAFTFGSSPALRIRSSSVFSEVGAGPKIGSSSLAGASEMGPSIRKTAITGARSEEHTSELQSLAYLVCRLLLEKKKKNHITEVIELVGL